MKEKYPGGQPCANKRASICSWSLEFTFRTREQCLYNDSIDYDE